MKKHGFIAWKQQKVQTSLSQGSHRLEKYLNIKGFLEKNYSSISEVDF